MADLIAQCMDADPAVRPSAKEVVALLSQPDAMLERHLPGRRPKPADVQVRHLREPLRHKSPAMPSDSRVKLTMQPVITACATQQGAKL